MNTYEKMSDRELDAMVAERVMGKRYWKERRGNYELCVGVAYNGREPWTTTRTEYQQPERYTPVSAMEAHKIGFFGTGNIPDYTTDPSAWWAIVEKMKANGFKVLLCTEGDEFQADFECQPIGGVCNHKNPGRAVCIAALLALDAQAGGA
jgi:hypothetical protein